MTTPLSLPDLARGARVQHELLVLECAERRKKDGEPFWVLTFGNRTGRIESAPVWHDRADWIAGATAGTVAQVIGEVDEYGGPGSARRQLRLTAPVRPLPADGRSLDGFLPHVDVPVEQLWTALDRARGAIRSSALRAVVGLFFCDADFRAHFARTPGSTGGHHARVGGLLQHTVEVAQIAAQSARAVRRASVDLVIAGALLHDVGKVEAYAVGAGGFAYTPAGLLVGHVVLGLLALERRLDASDPCPCSAEQRLELRHLLLSHHGKLEFGSPVPPMTVEAELVHWADEASAKATDVLDAMDDAELWPAGSAVSRRSWRVGRQLWRRAHAW